jgi:broad specificity phosphatase PhoE
VKLILVRHGKPETLSGRTPANPPLSAVGRQQSEDVARYLAGTQIDAIAHSGMERAEETARPLAERLNIFPKVIGNLGEVDRHGGEYANAEIIRARGPAEWRRFLSDPIGYFGIEPSKFRTETLAAFGQLLACPDINTVAIFTHGFPINVLLSHALGIDGFGHFLPEYGSITRVSGTSLDRLVIVSVNETGHLATLPASTS